MTAPITTSGMYAILLLALIALGVFGFVIPDKLAKKKRQQYLDGLKQGDTVTTLHGITGKITEVKGDNIVIRTQPDDVRFEIAKWGLKYK